MFLAGHSVALVTDRVTKIIPTCSQVIGQFSDTMIVASIDHQVLESAGNWKLSHLKTKGKDEFILSMSRNTISIPNEKFCFKRKTKNEENVAKSKLKISYK